ncbi:MAG: dTDP-glucose 4,6-dehydratase [Ruminiclostridium sp.]|nr:dTDP-glucose 4,6-dehydratase [Ruminiclostridium sp.]
MRIILVTGGAGFIGSNFIRYFLTRNKNFILINMDKLTYAGNLKSLKEINDSPRHHFIHGDICNYELVNYVMRKYRPEIIINFAAESHVDRSISNPSIFAETNIMGTLTLLESAGRIWSKQGYKGCKFLQVSTDEVYGSIDNNTDYFFEDSCIQPNSPYSASKAGADLMVRAFSRSFGIPAVISRCCNNYGPYQNREKFIPKGITCALRNEPIPIYGDGKNIREWIHVLDHCSALTRLIFYGKPGEVYNIGTGDELDNIELAQRILTDLEKPQDLIRFVNDRPGHDLRYALSSRKIKNSLGWMPKISFEEGLHQTIKWYKDNRDWWEG